MTSEEIKQKAAVDLSTNGWLREICIQVATLNDEKGLAIINDALDSLNVDNPPIAKKRAYTKRT
jgi:hypothetical protein